MSGLTLPPLPPQLKSIQHYLKTAIEHDKRDPVVSYYCRLYALQTGFGIDKKSPECKAFFGALMDHMEQTKAAVDDDAIRNDVVGQAHMESHAIKVFLYADNEDRAGRFNKNVVKSFYTAGMLFDTLSVFGEISEDIEKNKKYAKWKAAYIHKCLKNGETPVAGPLGGDEDSEFGAEAGACPPPAAIGFAGPGPSQGNQPDPSSYQPGSSSYQPSPGTYQPGPATSPNANNLNLPGSMNRSPQDTAGFHAPPSTPQEPQTVTKPAPVPANTYTTDWTPPKDASGVSLTPQQYQKAMKFCKYANSALQYEDSKTAIDNLTKALTLLTTGKES